ncbi:MAG: T9SS type A sorting domain-containing protein [Candidatus Zixiibacteriota bacterium]
MRKIIIILLSVFIAFSIFADNTQNKTNNFKGIKLESFRIPGPTEQPVAHRSRSHNDYHSEKPVPEPSRRHLSRPQEETEWAPASYLSLMSITDYCWTEGGQVFAMIGATAPLGVDDTSFSGTVEFDVIEENPNGSVSIYNGMMPGEPIEEIDLSGGEAFILIENSEAEFIGIRVLDPEGELKPSQPYGLDFLEGGEYAINCHIDGAKLYAPEFGGEGPFVWSMYLVDDEGKPVTQDADSFVVWIEEEEIDDESALIASMFGGAPARRINSMAIGGRTYFRVFNEEHEEVTLSGAVYYGDLVWEIDEEFTISAVDSGRAIAIIGFPSSGPVATVGREFSLAAMAFVPTTNSPDFTNNTTEVNLQIHDITGEESATYSPDGWHSLVSGIFGFNIEDSEADSFGIFVDIDTREEPELINMFNVPISVKAEDAAHRLHIIAPSIAFTGDTVSVFARTIDANGNYVEDYHGYFGLSVWGDFHTPPVPTIMIDDLVYSSYESENHYAETEEGQLEFLMQHGSSDTIMLKAFDAEIGMYYDQGYIGESAEYEVVFVEGSYDAPFVYDIFPPNEGFLETGREYMVSVAALDETGMPKRDHIDTALLEISGSATYYPDEIVFENGIANFIVSNEISEDVTVHISGGFPEDATEELHFIGPGDPGAIFIPIEDFMVFAGEDVELPIIAWGASGFITSYDGLVYFDVEEPDMDGSCEYIESSMLSGGIGSISLSNSDAEVITIVATSDSLEDAAYEMPFFCHLAMGEVDTALHTESDVEITFATYDGPWTDIVDYNGVFYAGIIEEYPNESCSYDTVVIVEDGFGIMNLSNTEAESVWVAVVVPDDELMVPDCDYYYDEYCIIGQAHFQEEAVSEKKPNSYEFKSFMPNPFNSSARAYLYSEEAMQMEFEVFNVLGKRVEGQVIDIEIGSNDIVFDAQNLKSGIYYYRITGKDYILKGRILYVR